MSRLAAQVDAGSKDADKSAGVKGAKGGKRGKGGKGSKAEANQKAVLAARKAHEEMLNKVPAAIRNMWSLLKAAKADKHQS